MEEKIGSNYDKFLIDQNDIEYYMAITMTLESKFEKVLSEGIVILFQLPDGKSMEWTFPYDATVEVLLDVIRTYTTTFSGRPGAIASNSSSLAQ